jgi:hypothetical protein
MTPTFDRKQGSAGRLRTLTSKLSPSIGFAPQTRFSRKCGLKKLTILKMLKRCSHIGRS